MGETVRTSNSGGGGTVTSQTDAGRTRTTGNLSQSGTLSGFSTDTESGHSHELYNHIHSMSADQFQHTHGVSIPSHSHTFSTPEIPAHTHTVSVPGAPQHSHSFSIPSHSHGVQHGIYFASVNPSNATVTIGEQSFTIGGTSFEGDITQYLIDDGSIPRGRFIEIKVTPDTLAYITISISAQGFIQSKGGGQF